MAESFIDVAQDFPRRETSRAVGSRLKSRTILPSSVHPGLPSADTRPLDRPTSHANQGRNKKIPPPIDADSQARPRRRTVGAGPDALKITCFFT